VFETNVGSNTRVLIHRGGISFGRLGAGRRTSPDPHPNPSPQGGGEHTRVCGSI
jgi:hypothetical protein